AHAWLAGIGFASSWGVDSADGTTARCDVGGAPQVISPFIREVPMSRSRKFLKQWSARRASTRRRPARFVPGFGALEARLVLSVSAFFTPQAGGLLTVIGDGVDDTVEVSRDDAGNLLVNGGAVSIQGGTPTVDNTSVVQGFGLGRHGNIKPNEDHGPLSG